MNILKPETLEKYQNEKRLLPFDPIYTYLGQGKAKVQFLTKDLILYEGDEYYRTFTHNQRVIWVKRINKEN